MGTVYVTQEDAFIGKTDERLNVRFDKKTILDVPLIKVDGVVVLGRATISPGGNFRTAGTQYSPNIHHRKRDVI